MKLLFTGSECAPFFKTGGLGDVMGALPKTIAKTTDNDVRVVLPFFTGMAEEYKNQLSFVTSFYVKVGWRDQYCGVLKLEMDNVTYYFIDNLYYFDRPGLYGYYDEGERFAFFQQAIIEMLEKIGFIPDILHVNDYHTAFIPFLLKEKYGWINAYQNIKTVLTIHNLQFQGEYGREVLGELFNLDASYYDDGTVRFDTAVNFMKTGILYADKVNTVSPTYASEIQTEAFGQGLDEILRMHNWKLRGILNGIDYERNNPATDKNLVANYSAKKLKCKVKDKLALQKEFGLPQRKDVSVIAMVSRLTAQKGFQLVVSEMQNLVQFDVQVIVLGTGDANFEHDFRYFADTYPEKVGAAITFDVGLAQRIYAGADMFLMPSAFEPCGLSQMISMRYGTLPIVHQIGGLQYSVQPFNPVTGEGTGIGFHDFSGFYMMQEIQEALRLYSEPAAWTKVVKQAMSQDFSWETASQEYLNMYNELV